MDEAMLAEVDRLAGQEGKTRSTWMRDVVANAVLASKLVGGGDTRHRADEESAASSVGRNDVGDARAASATDLGERSHPTYIHSSDGTTTFRGVILRAGDTIQMTESVTVGDSVPASGREGFDRPYPQPISNVIPRVKGAAAPVGVGGVYTGSHAEGVVVSNPRCRHPWWRRIGGVCLRCGEPVKMHWGRWVVDRGPKR